MHLLLRRTWHLKCSRKRSKDRIPPEAHHSKSLHMRGKCQSWGYSWRGAHCLRASWSARMKKGHFPAEGAMLAWHHSVMLGHFPNSSFHPSGGRGERVHFALEGRLRKITVFTKKRSLLSQREEASPGQTELAAQSLSQKRLHLSLTLECSGH